MTSSRFYHPASDDGVPPAIPGYTLYQRIGRGSSGAVWLATDAMNKWRAVKVVNSRGEGGPDHGYEREFNAIKRYEEVAHLDASLMRIVHVGRDPNGRFFYYAMELADAASGSIRLETQDDVPERMGSAAEAYRPRTLRSEIRQRGRLPPSECITHGIALAFALERLHAQGLIHRDIKPDNIIFVRGKPKLADVGLVADADAAYSLAGTTAYLSPEPVRKEPADIFALGKALYEMLTGRDAQEFPMAPRDFAAFGEDERREFNELNAVILRACEPELEQRYSTARDLRTDLELLDGNQSVLLLRALEARDRQRQRFVRRFIIGGLVFGGVLLLATLLFYAWSVRQRADEEAWRRELGDIRAARFKFRAAGWSKESWSRLERAAAFRMDGEVVEQATAVLTGLDASRVSLLEGKPVAAAAFGPDGSALLGGAGDAPTLLLGRDGVIRELATRGEGPVGWATDGTPLQLAGVTNGLELHEALTASVRRRFSLPRPPASGSAAPHLWAMSPDGRAVAAAWGDQVAVWNGTSGELFGEVAVESPLTAMAFSADAALLGAGCANGFVRVYETRSVRELAALPPAVRENPTTCLAFGRNPWVRYTGGQTNASLLAVGHQGGSLVVWDVGRSLPLSFCLGAPWNVRSLAFHPDGITLSSVGRLSAQVWDVSSGRRLLSLSGTSSGDSRALAFDRSGLRLVYGGEAGVGTARTALWELQRHRGVQLLRGLTAASRKVWFSPDSRRIAALSDDWHLAVWDAVRGDVLFILETPVGDLADNAGGCFDSTGQRFGFATGTEARLYDLANGQVIQQWRLDRGRSDQVQFDGEGRWLLLRRERIVPVGGELWRLYELAAPESPVLLHEQMESDWSPLEVVFRPGGAHFLVASRRAKTGQFIRAYEVATGRALWEKPLALEAVSNVRMIFDPTGRWLAYNWQNKTPHFRLMDFPAGVQLRESPEPYEAISPSGAQFAGEGSLFPGVDGHERSIPFTRDWAVNEFVCAFSPNGRLLAYGTFEGAVLVAHLEELQSRLASLQSAATVGSGGGK